MELSLIILRSFAKKPVIDKGGSRTAATSKEELFVIIVNGFQPLIIITKISTLDVAAVLDLPFIDFYQIFKYTSESI